MSEHPLLRQRDFVIGVTLAWALCLMLSAIYRAICFGCLVLLPLSVRHVGNMYYLSFVFFLISEQFNNLNYSRYLFPVGVAMKTPAVRSLQEERLIMMCFSITGSRMAYRSSSPALIGNLLLHSN